MLSALERYCLYWHYKNVINNNNDNNNNYANALLYGLPKKSINMLQTVQNMCARLVVQCAKYTSVTQALMDHHWLPIEQ